MESIKLLSRVTPVRQQARSLLVFALLTAIGSGMAARAHAQTFEEWFSQKKTQQKYLLQQIAALQVYSKYLKAGYGVAQGGLGSISGSLRSENGSHDTYYARLQVAGPVKNDPMVRDIMNRQKDILNSVHELDKESGFRREEKSYLAAVGTAVLQDCDQQMQTLANITQDGKLKMSDADRLSLLNKVHTAMEENYRFITSFSAQVKLYATRKQAEQNDLKTTKGIYGPN